LQGLPGARMRTDHHRAGGGIGGDARLAFTLAGLPSRAASAAAPARSPAASSSRLTQALSVRKSHVYAQEKMPAYPSSTACACSEAVE
jgi:hypothetical protein